jgi:hypothetical protein
VRGHLRAAAAFVTDAGAHVVAAVCGARAAEALIQSGGPLSPSVDELRELQPDPDWLLPETVDGIEL